MIQPLPLLKLFIVLLVCHPLQGASFVFFHPPTGWSLTNPTTLKENTQVGFVASKRKSFTPSINLSLDLSGPNQEAYINAVRQYYESDQNKEVRFISSIQTKSGSAQLMQIEWHKVWGDVVILQSFLMQEEHVYILTASCLKKEFSSLRNTLLQSFRTIQIFPNLFASIEDPNTLKEMIDQLKKDFKAILSDQSSDETFQSSCFQKHYWQPTMTLLSKRFKTMGPCWQALVIQSIQNQLLKIN